MDKDNYGRIIYTEHDLINLIYKGINIESCCINDPELVNQYNSAVKNNFDVMPLLQSKQDLWNTIKDFDQANQASWFIPEEYKNMDIEGYLVHVCPKQNYQRLIEELRIFRSKNMLNLLRWLKYFVDICKKNNIIKGVGRGSSVASYVLYLLDVHKIDPIKYDLDISEFFKEFEHEKNI